MPFANRDYAHFYAGLAERRIVAQACDECGERRFPPGPMCPKCLSLKWSTVDSAREGRIHSYTVHHHPPLNGYPVPHAIALAEMDDGLRLLAALPGVAVEKIEIGMRVHVEFFDMAADYPMFRFAPADS